MMVVYKQHPTKEPEMQITYVPLEEAPGVMYVADVEEYEPGFAEGTDVVSNKPVVLYWDGDDWVETTED